MRNDSTASNTQVAWNAGANGPLLQSNNTKNFVSEVTKNATSVPPPGFLTQSKQKGEGTSVPPGFQGNSKKLENNDEHNAKHISTKSSEGLYIPPKNFASRNSDLLNLITKLMGGVQSTRFSSFKSLSTQFRSGAISCANYHKQCLELVDLTSFELFFPELLCLLPDINKQGVSIGICFSIEYTLRRGEKYRLNIFFCGYSRIFHNHLFLIFNSRNSILYTFPNSPKIHFWFVLVLPVVKLLQRRKSVNI